MRIASRRTHISCPGHTSSFPRAVCPEVMILSVRALGRTEGWRALRKRQSGSTVVRRLRSARRGLYGAIRSALDSWAGLGRMDLYPASGSSRLIAGETLAHAPVSSGPCWRLKEPVVVPAVGARVHPAAMAANHLRREPLPAPPQDASGDAPR